MTMKNVTLKELWDLVLREIKKRLNNDQSAYSGFFAPTELYSLEKDEAIIKTDSNIAKEMLQKTYNELLSSSLRKVTETEYKITILSSKEIDERKNKDFSNLKRESKKEFFENSFISPNYTFDNFIVGKSNMQAYQSAMYVAKNPGNFNPLFIYSKSGLGKTHLLNAIGNLVKNDNPSKKVLYITTEDFVDEFVKFVQGDKDRSSLKDFFNTIDFLLIDDIQFLSNKPGTSTMFFNIFNSLVKQNKQIVITSDRTPSQLDGLEDRLVSRFSQGLSVSIEKPEKHTLIEILKLKIKSNGFDSSLFEDEALEFIAENNSKNIRELEGALNRILFFNVTSNNVEKINLDICKQAFNISSKDDKKADKLNASYIIQTVASYYNLTENQIMSKVRTLQISLARSIAMYLCRNILDMSLSSIAKEFDKKDHTTIMSACKKVDNLLKTDDNTKKAIKQLTKKIKS